MTDDWLTPREMKERLGVVDHFDPCPYPRPEWDGLQIEWESKNFVNPPFSNITAWVRKARVEVEKGKSVVFIHPINNSLTRLLEGRADVLSKSDARFLDPTDGKLKRINYDILVVRLP